MPTPETLHKADEIESVKQIENADQPISEKIEDFKKTENYDPNIPETPDSLKQKSELSAENEKTNKGFAEAGIDRVININNPEALIHNFHKIQILRKTNQTLANKLETQILNDSKKLRTRETQMLRQDFIDTNPEWSDAVYAIQIMANLRPEVYDQKNEVKIDGIEGKKTKKARESIIWTPEQRKIRHQEEQKSKQDQAKKEEKDKKSWQKNKRDFAKQNFDQNDDTPVSMSDFSMRDIRWNQSLKSYLKSHSNKDKEKTNTQTLQALAWVLDEIRDHLDTTTYEQINFANSFNWNPRNNENLSIDDDKIQIKWNLAWEPAIPVIFNYDMHTGLISMNSSLNYKNGNIHINNTQANIPLFITKPFENFKKPEAKAEKLLRRSTDAGRPFQKELVELNLEKNKAISLLTETFDLNNKPDYNNTNSRWVYHLLQIINNSIKTSQDARLFRQQITRLNQMIERKDIHSDQKHSVHEDSNILDSNWNNQIHPILHQFFNTQKRIQDKNQLWTTFDQNNGIYQFFRGFTSNIKPELGTNFFEDQKINLDQFKDYLTKLEQDNKRKTQVQKHDSFTKKEQSTANDRLSDNRPPDIN